MSQQNRAPLPAPFKELIMTILTLSLVSTAIVSASLSVCLTVISVLARDSLSPRADTTC
jgi:hypothetical protein